MKARHTPGIWTYLISSVVAHGTVDTFDGSVLVPIVTINETEQTDEEGRVFSVPGTQAANGRLIAAAPLLFSALQRIVRNGYLVDDVPDDVLNHALQALEQVEGDE